MVSPSIAGSQVDPKEINKLDDFSGIDLPMDKFTKQLQASTDDMGFELIEEQLVVEPTFKVPIKKLKV